ncbi:MAG: hypothetical protein KDK70_06500 [Myxococcales bacterium]|nr:hypothetical protein [Myxococcales bacterium]
MLAPAGCTSDEWPPLPPAEESSTTAAPEDYTWDGARLEVIEPASPSIHRLGEPLALRAQLVDPLGLPIEPDGMDDVELAWLDTAGIPLLDGLQGDVELPAGVHELRAVARLPSGDRLESAVGGVRVQARWTGAYEGDVLLVIEASLPGGNPLELRCEGPLSLVASLDGRSAEAEDGACTFDAFGQTVHGTYAIDIVVYDAGLLRGTADFSFESGLGTFELPIEWAGAFYDDRFSAGLSGAVDLPFVGIADASGSLQAQRIDPWVDPDAG